MSEVKTDKLTGVSTAGSILVTGEGNSTTTNLQQGLAKQWVYFNMASTTAVDSLNTSSLTDSGTGLFKVNINNDFNNTSYTANYTGNANTGDTFPANVTCIAKFNYLAGGHAAGVYDAVSYGGSALVDGKYNYCTAHGDLA